ncbi:peroxisome assembly protein 12 [Patella vulgata]|uniref:peroxisome assembly protein 12 n=1 Tax=Patella vulgata TaxID=6465 RepID=UPI00218058E1|nr:peroxisome assembly protein 12 [Patella vulgata]XP_050409897.1 peroxisome assembly protein 12 [Patella vulgata]
MAQHGAHITSVNLSADRPTVFEVLAQESLSTTIRPAAKHAVKVLAESRPDRFGWMLQFFDEVYTVLELLVQNYYLQRYCGSFAENFYDLRRIVSKTKSPVLSNGLRWKSLICLVVLPYLKQKLDKYFEDMRHRSHFISSQKDYKSRLNKAFLAVYPYIHMLWEGSNLWFQLAYMFGKSDWHSWLLRFSGTELRRKTEDEETRIQKDIMSWQSRSVQQKIYFILYKTVDMLAVTMSTGLSVGVFFLQFLEWWYQREEKAVSLTALPIPEPPKEQSPDNVNRDWYNSCPICEQTRQNDTALSVSGYVFCFRCIHSYIKKHGCCPITHYPAQIDCLIKIYPPDT